MFIPGQVYNRRKDIHAVYSGQQQGGICTPARHPFIFIFTGDNGEEFGYSDGWTKEGIYQYTGEGQVGDMQFIKGNKAIRDHVSLGKEILLFQYVDSGIVKFISNMICIGYHYRESKDKNKDMRQAIVFELQKVEDYKHEGAILSDESNNLNNKSLKDLRNMATNSEEKHRTIVEKQKEVRVRSNAVKEYALQRASGKCEFCNEQAPFSKDDGTPYLEVHHIKRLSDGGPDKPEWVAGVCPNCHREAHYGVHRDQLNSKLLQVISKKEKELMESLT